jgi:hypothetical protein
MTRLTHSGHLAIKPLPSMLHCDALARSAQCRPIFSQVANLANEWPHTRRLLADHYAFFNAGRRLTMI